MKKYINLELFNVITVTVYLKSYGTLQGLIFKYRTNRRSLVESEQIIEDKDNLIKLIEQKTLWWCLRSLWYLKTCFCCLGLFRLLQADRYIKSRTQKNEGRKGYKKKATWTEKNESQGRILISRHINSKITLFVR